MGIEALLRLAIGVAATALAWWISWRQGEVQARNEFANRTQLATWARDRTL